jgi:adenylate cyclase
MFHLTIFRPDGHEVEQGFSRDKIIVGRHEKCDLRLVDSLISRNHCLIFREGKRYVVKDLASRNGTWLNGRKVKNRGTIKKGDAIQVGPFRIIFEPGIPTAETYQIQTLDMPGMTQEPFVHKDETEQVVKPLGMISSYLSETTGARRRPEKARRERLNRNLLTIYKITEELVVKEDLDEILERIMDLLFDTFDPSQAAILLREGSGPPLPKKERSAEGTGNVRAVSNTIINRVLDDRIGIITDNALEDPRFDSGDSVIIDGIRSVMAAPIWEDQSILGVLYLDSLDFINGYQSEDLDLLTAIGHQAALAIQRHNLTEMLKEEAVKNAVIRENLGRFHSPPVVDLILKGAADLEVKETLATIFFCDVVNFTSLCESCTPKQLQNLLSIFCKTVNEVIFQEQGTLDKFIGDAALAIFGAPLPQEDAPLRAVRAALKIREQLDLAQRTISPELHFQVRYGIDTGNAVVGNFGSDERMDYTILGHAVNLASRISKTAEPDQILIGAETFAGVQESRLFQIRSVGLKRLKGVKGTMKLFEVEGFL